MYKALNIMLVGIIAFVLSILATPATAFAYVGPGVGVGVIGVIIGIFTAIFLAFVGLLWYPIKRLVKGGSSKSVEADTAEGKEQE